MSTLYNRRRGAKAHQPRKPRPCRAADLPEDLGGGVVFERRNICLRLAPRNRYCSDHQRV
jgi:hypothetical protein